MAMITIARDGKTLGSFPEEAVREGLRSNQYLPTDLGWREGMAAWQPLSQFPEFAQSDPGAIPPAAEAVATIPAYPAAVPMPTARTEPLAIWSLVLSLVGLFCCGFVFGAIGVVCGHLALSKIGREPALQGRPMAIAGLVIGYVAVAFWLLWILFFGGAAFLHGISQGTSR